MFKLRRQVFVSVLLAMILGSGCAAPRVEFASLKRPARAVELDAYEPFVGSWAWEAKIVGSTEPKDAWTGTARWDWDLDKRCLRGKLSAKSPDLGYESTGLWSWNPDRRQYEWWILNDWGYPQAGSADYRADRKAWTMNFRSLGLDGTTSHGRYELKILDRDTIEWHLTEWADALHLIRKIEMTGSFKRKGV